MERGGRAWAGAAGEEAEEDAALLEAAGPSDVLVAVRAAGARLLPRRPVPPPAAMRNGPGGARGASEHVPSDAARTVAPFALRSQIKALLPTLSEIEVEEELQALRQARYLRLLRFPGAPQGSTSCCIVMWEDYEAAVERAKGAALQRAAGAKVSKYRICTIERAFDRFRNGILLRCLGESVGEAELRTLLLPTSTRSYTGEVATIAPGGSGGGEGAGDSEKAEIDELVRAGLLAPQIDRDGGEYFYFALPGVGKVAKSINLGRRDLLKALARRRRQEMLERDVLRLRLPNTFLETRFHIQDALGAGFITARESPAGLVLRLAPNCARTPAARRKPSGQERGS